jgi:hypothetical protein
MASRQFELYDKAHSIDLPAAAPSSSSVQYLMRSGPMTKRIDKLSKHHRYQLVHGDDADFVAYQRQIGKGAWRTLSTWMVPHAA